MDEADLEAELELAADLNQMVHDIQTGFHMGEPPSVWMARRRQIAGLRQRIRVMRARHLAGLRNPSPPGPPLIAC
ncbi:MAG: hypothetical protein JO057_30695 [Chloroflexi bacterium]|nr:hypothetical protein [Chloroflexota bacterium]